VTLAKRVLQQENVPYQEVFIDKDMQARERVLRWTGFLSVPTLVVSENGSGLPTEEPVPLAYGTSPRGIDRGAMITEPSSDELLDWLRKHHFIG
jgi:glutaredoxin